MFEPLLSVAAAVLITIAGLLIFNRLSRADLVRDGCGVEAGVPQSTSVIRRLVSRKLAAFVVACSVEIALTLIGAPEAVLVWIAQGLMVSLPVLIGGQAYVDAKAPHPQAPQAPQAPSGSQT